MRRRELMNPEMQIWRVPLAGWQYMEADAFSKTPVTSDDEDDGCDQDSPEDSYRLTAVAELCFKIPRIKKFKSEVKSVMKNFMRNANGGDCGILNKERCAGTRPQSSDIAPENVSPATMLKCDVTPASKCEVNSAAVLFCVKRVVFPTNSRNEDLKSVWQCDYVKLLEKIVLIYAAHPAPSSESFRVSLSRKVMEGGTQNWLQCRNVKFSEVFCLIKSDARYLQFRRLRVSLSRKVTKSGVECLWICSCSGVHLWAPIMFKMWLKPSAYDRLPQELILKKIVKVKSVPCWIIREESDAAVDDYDDEDSADVHDDDDDDDDDGGGVAEMLEEQSPRIFAVGCRPWFDWNAIHRKGERETPALP